MTARAMTSGQEAGIERTRYRRVLQLGDGHARGAFRDELGCAAVNGSMIGHRSDLGFGFGFSSSVACRSGVGSTIDLLGLEALLRMAVALHGNQLAHSAPARGIALAIENKVDGLAGLRTDEC